MRRRIPVVFLMLVLGVLIELLAGRVFSPDIILLRGIRALLGTTTGFVLGSTGAALQRAYSNPLADGYILGISGGAVFGLALSEMLELAVSGFIFSFVGSLVVGGMLLFLTRGLKPDLIPVIGIGLGMFSSSLAVLLFMMAGVEASRTFYALWGTLGRFYEYRDIPVIAFTLPVSLVFLLPVLFSDREMDALSLGRDEALALGYDPDRAVRNITVFSAISVSLITSLVGIVGFVGVMSAHISRMYGVFEGKPFYISAGLVGAVLVLLSDAFGRVVLGIDPPIGIIMSVIGAPFFVYLALKRP